MSDHTSNSVFRHGEKVQRRATKLVTSLAKLTYEQRLRHLRLHSLYCRRQRGDLIETFKILNGLENVEASNFFEMRQPVPEGTQ